MKNKLMLEEAFLEAQKIARLNEPKASLILDLIIERKRRGYLNLIFAYLRWVDNTVDNPQNLIELKIEFIHRQKEIIKNLIDSKEIEYKCAEEIFLSYLIDHLKENESPLLIEELNNMVEAISWDVERLKKDGIFSESELSTYINKMAKSLYNILNIFVIPVKSSFNPQLFFGKFTANAQMLRDLLEDINAGLINISREDIQKYNLNARNLIKDINLKKWLIDRIPYVMNILWEETNLSWKAPLKNKLYIYCAHIYYLPKIYRLQIYKYNLEKIKYNRSFVKEIIVYFISTIMVIRLLFQNFVIIPKKILLNEPR